LCKHVAFASFSMQLQVLNHSHTGLSSSNRGRLLVLSQD